jgi:hypothetical protein
MEPISETQGRTQWNRVSLDILACAANESLEVRLSERSFD